MKTLIDSSLFQSMIVKYDNEGEINAASREDFEDCKYAVTLSRNLINKGILS